jgi:putative redox protein
MDAKLTLLERMTFQGVADSGHEIIIDGRKEVGGDDSAVHPMELMALSLGSCTAMDVVSILRKKQQDVAGFEVRLHIDRAAEHPKIFTRAVLTYEVRGENIEETAVRRAMALSLEKYCPAHAMLSKVFPMEYRFIILDRRGELMIEGIWEPQTV